MKVLAFILSFYVLVLAAMPCVDVPKDNNLHNFELTNSLSDHHEHENDLCSPFCTCDCCVSPIINNLTVYFTFICSPLAQKLTKEYDNSFVSSPITTIWHPPKLS